MYPGLDKMDKALSRVRQDWYGIYPWVKMDTAFIQEKRRAYILELGKKSWLDHVRCWFCPKASKHSLENHLHIILVIFF